jgi:hypothetical protein
MQPIIICADPEKAPAIFKDGSYFIIDEAVGIARIMKVSGKFSVTI